MNHQIMITVDGYSWIAIATTHHNGKAREVSAISCVDVPLQVMAALDEHVINVHDVLELVRTYLNDTTVVRREATCGAIEITWYPLNAVALREDITGNTYSVKLVANDGAIVNYEVGAASSWGAMDICKDALQKPVRSSVVIPLGF